MNINKTSNVSFGALVISPSLLNKSCKNIVKELNENLDPLSVNHIYDKYGYDIFASCGNNITEKESDITLDLVDKYTGEHFTRFRINKEEIKEGIKHLHKTLDKLF